MQNCCPPFSAGWHLSRLMSLLLLSSAIMLADTITTFDVSGTAFNRSDGKSDSCARLATCSFSGTLQIDVTAGAIDDLDITLPGVPAFDSLGSSNAVLFPSNWLITAYNSTLTEQGLLSPELTLFFSTAPTPGSLVGFTGGSILSTSGEFESFVGLDSALNLYDNFNGSITPVPEPLTLVPLAGGLGWLVFGLVRRRFGKKSAR